MSNQKDKQKEKLQQDIKNYQRYIELLNELRTPKHKCLHCQGNKFRCHNCIAGIKVVFGSREDKNKYEELNSLKEKLRKKYLCNHCNGNGTFRFEYEDGYFEEDCHYCNGNQILSPEEKQ